MEGAPPSPRALHRAWAGLLLANLFLATVLTVSGLLLLALYRPGSTLVAVHRLAGRALLVTVGLSLVPLLAWRRRPAAAAGAAGRFVLVDRRELEPSTVVALLTLHLVAGMVTGLAALTVVARRANGLRGRVGGTQPPGGVRGPPEGERSRPGRGVRAVVHSPGGRPSGIRW